MDIRFSEMHESLVALPIGGVVEYKSLDGRAIKQMLGDVTYFFQGHVEPGDERIGKPGCDYIEANWNWRVVYEWRKNAANRQLYDLTLTKVDAPADHKYSGQVRKMLKV